MGERLAAAFARGRAEKRKLLITYVCAGDPSLEATARLLPELAAAGADVIELGVPFSDPVADGPVIEAASQRALAAGATLDGVLTLAKEARARGLQVPLVLMGYLNPIVAMGFSRFGERAKEAEVDGVIVPDLPLEESAALREALVGKLALVLLAAPTTPPARLAQIGARSEGFLYYVSVTGVTGARAALPSELPAQLAAVRATSRVPVAVGFGVGTPEQARALAPHADAVVVGSALVRAIHEGKDAPALVRALASGLAAS